MKLRIFFIILSSLFLYGLADARLYEDDLGRRVNIPCQPGRIISLAPSITDTLFALGLDKEIVGVTTVCSYPDGARSKPKIGSFVSVSLERIVLLKPDLVIGTADGNKREAVKHIERAGFPVYVVNPRNIEDIFSMVMQLGAITGRKSEAEILIRSLRARVDRIVSVTAHSSRPKVFLQVGIDTIITAGKNTFIDELIDRAGGINIAADSIIRYPHYKIEDIIIKEPDIIIVSLMKERADTIRVQEKWKRWNDIPAVKNNRVYVVDSDLINQPSPRIVDGLEEMVKIIHPELY